MSIELDRPDSGVAALLLSVSKKNGTLADYELAHIVEESLARPAEDRESDPRTVGVHRQTLRQTLSREVALFDSAHFWPFIFEAGN
jgi:hypothetical protein